MKIFKKILGILAAAALFTGITVAATILPVPQGGTGVNTIGVPSGSLIQGNATAPFSAVTIGSGLQLLAGVLSNTGSSITQITGANSVNVSPGPCTAGTCTISLVNDGLAPINAYYGTDGLGTLGYHSVPTGTIGGAATANQVSFGQAPNVITSDNNFTYKPSGLFNVGWSGSGANHSLLNADDTSGSVSIGDTTGGYNRVNWLVQNGASNSIIGHAAQQFSIQDTANHPFFVQSLGGQTTSIGDLAGAFGGGTTVWDENANTVANNGFVWNFGNTLVHGIVDPVSAQDAATKNYVDTVAATNLNWRTAVMEASAGPLPTYVYNNGAGGVGATITKTGNGALVLDGITAATNDRVLIKDETGGNTPFNGIYTVTNTGSVGTPFIITRTPDANSVTGLRRATVAVTLGAVNNNTAWTNTTITVTVGTTNVTFVNILNTVYVAGPGLSLAGHTFSLDTTHSNTWQANQLFNSGNMTLVGATSGKTTLNTAAATTNHTVTLPATVCSAGQTWTDSGAGVMSCATNGSGTVTSVSTGTGLTGGPITTSGTISLANTAVTPGSYTNTNLTVDAQGRITAAANGSGGTTSIDSLTAGTLQTLTCAGTCTLNGNNGTIFTTTLTANNTVTLSNLKVGIPYTFLVKQDGTGSRTNAWSSSLGIKVSYGGSGTPPISTAANAQDKYSVVSDGTNAYIDYALNYN